MVRSILILVIILGVSGCRSFDVVDLPFVEDRFEVDNSDFDTKSDSKSLSNSTEQVLELQFNNAGISELCDLIRLKTDYSLVTKVPDGFTFSGFYVGTVGKILSDIALANDLNFTRLGKTFYLFDADSAAFDVTAVLNCPVISDDILSRVFPGVILHEGNKIIVHGNLNDVIKLQDFIEDFDLVMPYNYVVTVVQVDTTAELAYNLQLQIMSKGIDLLTPGVTAWDVFSAAARVSGNVLDFDSYHERQFYVTDGKKMTYNQTTDKKVENRAISDAGTSTVTSYSDVQAGAIVDLTLQASYEDFVTFLSIESLTKLESSIL